MFNYGRQCNVLDAKILNDMIGYVEIKKGSDLFKDIRLLRLWSLYNDHLAAGHF